LRPNRLSYRILAAVVIAGVVLVAPGPAYAAAPTNDTFAGATAIGAVPFSTTVDTSEATTDADDANANAICGAPSTDASVWFSLYEAKPVSLLDFAVYLSFFPHLVAGPIVRAVEFLPQLRQRPDPRYIEASRAFRLIIAGLFKKVVVSSFLASVRRCIPNLRAASEMLKSVSISVWWMRSHSSVLIDVGRASSATSALPSALLKAASMSSVLEGFAR